MAELPNMHDLVKAILSAGNAVLKKDLPTIRGFADDQLKRLAKFTVWIAEADVAGEFRDDRGLRDDFLLSLQDMTRDFVNTLRGLTMITIEKLWNAIIKVLWDALDKAAGVALPRPI